MKFLFPNMMWGLLFLLIPIIVHLFNLRRAKKVQFSNVRFLSVIKSTSSSKLVLKHYLSLVFRLLFILFLVIAFSAPYMNSNGEETFEDKTNIVYLDNSYSNTNLYNAAISGFEKNSALVTSMVDESDKTRRFRLYTNENIDISNRTPLVKEKFLEKLTEVQLTSFRIDLDQLSNKIQRYDDENKVYVFSDFQREQFSLSDFSDTINNYILVPSKYNSARNVFIDTIFLEGISIETDRRNTLNIVFRNSGVESVEDLSVNLITNGTQLSTNTIDLGAEKKVTLSVDLGLIKDSITRCEISFEDFPMTFDNRFYFVIKQTDPISVLDIGRNSQTAFSSLFDSDLFEYQFVSSSNINYSALKKSDLVLLNEVSLDDPSLIREVKAFLGDGGTVLIIPDEGINISALEEILNKKVKQFDQPLLSIEKPDITDPFFRDIFDSDPDDAKMPESNSILTWSSGRPLMSFSNSKPYLSNFDIGEGNLFLLAGDLTSSGNDFTQNALFLPVMYNIGFISSNSSPFRLYTRMSEDFVSVELVPKNNNSLYKLRKSDREIIPQQRLIDGKLLIKLRDLKLEPGFWELIHDENVVDVLALNHSLEESFINQYSIDEIAEFSSLHSNVSVLNMNDSQNWRDSTGQGTNEKKLWKYSLILALLFFFAEVLTLRFL